MKIKFKLCENFLFIDLAHFKLKSKPAYEALISGYRALYRYGDSYRFITPFTIKNKKRYSL